MGKAIWTDSTPEQKVILITLLMMANHEGKEWHWQGEKFKAEPGQFVTSLKNIAEKSGQGITIQNVRTSLKKFETYEFLTNKSTNKNRLITIVNWELYQGDKKKSTKKVTSDQQATNKQLTTNKNDKNDKNNIYSDFSEIISCYPGNKTKHVRDNKLPKIIKEYGYENILYAVKAYAKKCQGKDKKYILNESTFWGGRFLDYLPQEEKPKEEFKPNFIPYKP